MKETLGIEFTLFLIFLILKLTNTVNWSWWLIFLPLYWMPAVLVTIVLLVGTCLAIVAIKERMFCSK